MVKSSLDRHVERGQFGPQDRQQVHLPLATRQGVTEQPARREGRRAGGQDPQPGELVRADLEEARRIGQLMDLVEDDDRLADIPIEQHRVAGHGRHRGQVAVQVPRLPRSHGTRKRRLARSSRAGEPCDGRLEPGLLDPVDPERSSNRHRRHTIHLARPDA